MGIQINGQNDEIRAVDGSGTVHLDVEGNITGNLTGNADSATTATNALGITTSQINVGDTFLKATNQVGLGQTTTAGRNAGINTAIGTIIYNTNTFQTEVYKGAAFGWQNISHALTQATGGQVSDYTVGSTVYRAHIFNSSGTFNVTSVGSGTVDLLLIAGGGGGGGSWSASNVGNVGGRGAGGLYYRNDVNINKVSKAVDIKKNVSRIIPKFIKIQIDAFRGELKYFINLVRILYKNHNENLITIIDSWPFIE